VSHHLENVKFNLKFANIHFPRWWLNKLRCIKKSLTDLCLTLVNKWNINSDCRFLLLFNNDQRIVLTQLSSTICLFICDTNNHLGTLNSFCSILHKYQKNPFCLWHTPTLQNIESKNPKCVRCEPHWEVIAFLKIYSFASALRHF